MIENATLLRIDRATPTAAGATLFAEGDDLSIRCASVALTSQQRFQLGATVKNVTSVVYLEKQPLRDGGIDAPELGDRLLVAIDSEDPAGELLLVVTDDGFEHGSQSHHELFSRKV